MAEKNKYKKMAEAIGANELVKETINSDYGLIPIIKKGLMKKNLLKLADDMNLSLKDFSQFLPISERTIKRYKKTERLSPIVSERLLKLAKLYTKGVEVFNEKNRFLHWMNSFILTLGSKPVELLETDIGIELVINELGRIEYGVYS